MHRRTGNFEAAFVHLPEESAAERRVFQCAGSVSFGWRGFSIRDAQMPGENITILEESIFRPAAAWMASSIRLLIIRAAEMEATFRDAMGSYSAPFTDNGGCVRPRRDVLFHKKDSSTVKPRELRIVAQVCLHMTELTLTPESGRGNAEVCPDVGKRTRIYR